MTTKTEPPTLRRLRKAREAGDLPISGALVQGVGFLAAVALAPAAATAVAARAAQLVRAAIEQPARSLSAVELAGEVLTLTVPILAAAAVAGVAAGFVQTGGVVAFGTVAPDLRRANPLAGLKSIFTWQRVLWVARALVAALVVGWLAVRLVLDSGTELASAVGSPLGAAALAAELARRLAWIAALVGLALAVVDVMITRYSWHQRLKMSRTEVREELKEAEGDPELKAARKRAHQELLRGASLAAVEQAAVVVASPGRLATALEYDQDEDEAPRVLAQGQGELARKLLDVARSYDVPVVIRPAVAEELRRLEPGEEIPVALFDSVAEILREAWREQGA